jgi:hypothetical protein
LGMARTMCIKTPIKYTLILARNQAWGDMIRGMRTAPKCEGGET